VPIVAGPMLVLTYLLLHGATPDAALHEHILDALRAVILNDAALQRDVLKARAGLLRNYDPLVQSVENLRDAAATLQAAGRIAYGGSNAEIDRRLDGSRSLIRRTLSRPSSRAMRCCRIRSAFAGTPSTSSLQAPEMCDLRRPG
jgi:DAHL domain